MPFSSDFTKLKIKSFYSETGQTIFESVVYPILSESCAYDRLTGYFSTHALVASASGLEGLFRNKGKMRLVIGIHDVPEELMAALAIGKLLPIQLVEDYKQKVLSEIGFLTDQSQKNALTIIGWMMRSGLLEVRVAAPRNTNGIYHQKRMIFKDNLGNLIAGTGSLNETIGGQQNVEEMQFNFSWPDSHQLIAPLVDSFDSIWNGVENNIEIISLDESFATSILAQLGNPPNPLDVDLPSKMNTAKSLLTIARNSPTFVPFNISNAALYPHQERVFVEALSRWPVRVLLADEVGLGKTLEAGSLISYMTRYRNLSKITIFAPASLLRQWQEEMIEYFGLKFWRWESASRSYVDPDGTSLQCGFAGNELYVPPNLRLVSAQWARLNEDLIQESLPEMLLVDEAHAARVSIDQYGVRTTKLWNLLNAIKNKIPHFVLMTATPMQVQPAEYHGLLKLLGLDDDWSNFSTYENSLKIISQVDKKPTLQDSSELADLINSSVSSHDWLPELLDEKELSLLIQLRAATDVSSVDKSILVSSMFEEFKKILIKIHPAHLLTCRNTKSGLQKFGYEFPERLFTSPEVFMEGALREFEKSVEIYLSNGYGEVEAALNPEGKSSVGFAKSGYYQRMVSSFFAAKKTLESRKNKIQGIQSALSLGDYSSLEKFFQDDDELLDDEETNSSIDLQKFGKLTPEEISQIVMKVTTASRLEISYINDLLSILNSSGEDVIHSDPKFKSALLKLSEAVSDSQVLVFSRYTDTLNGFVRLFEVSELSKQVEGYAFYTGGNVWIQSQLGRREGTKKDVTEALRSNEIQIVFCSDAASEGLNLQTAQCLMNLDVPWNPARLEQRIGRIARLGQKSKQVQIVNFWYPKSIEAKMYQRLLSRRDDYQLTVGEFPEIFSDAIRSEVTSTLNKSNSSSSDPLVDLQNMRNDFQRVALEAVWGMNDSGLPPSELFRKGLVEFIDFAKSKQDEWSFSTPYYPEAGRKGSVTLFHEALDQAVEIDIIDIPEFENELVNFEFNGVSWGIGIIGSEGSYKLLRSSALPKLMKASIGGEPLEENDLYPSTFKRENILEEILRNIRSDIWHPNHDHATVPYSGELIPTPLGPEGELVIKKIGNVSVN